MKRVWRERWVRWHLWVGVVLAPYLVVYGLSGLLLSHPDWVPTSERSWERSLEIAPGAAPETAAAVRDALGLAGRLPRWKIEAPSSEGGPLRFRIVGAGRFYDVDWFAAERRARVLEGSGGWLGMLRALHGLRDLPGSRLGAAWGVYTWVSLAGLPFLIVSGALVDVARWRRRRQVAILGGALLAGWLVVVLWLALP